MMRIPCCVRLANELLGLVEGAERRVDRAVVLDVVSAVGLRGLVPGGEPDRIDAQARAGTAAGRARRAGRRPRRRSVREAADVDLVDDRVAPPAGIGRAGGLLGVDEHCHGRRVPSISDTRGRSGVCLVHNRKLHKQNSSAQRLQVYSGKFLQRRGVGESASGFSAGGVPGDAEALRRANGLSAVCEPRSPSATAVAAAVADGRRGPVIPNPRRLDGAGPARAFAQPPAARCHCA